ncbi:type I restriction endonuclease subunit R [Nanchangia anserum]|uniref:Type I restriction enzyme endonuclease subunit n=1 Tax=Nanchangia anserum TaxID=2692125 RepID=A0A8I0GET5_9ACTO|nr:HsdR family type I site-specific deoxyribonuclease [Nanchangia anserum]MBD3690183.1 type I restriction endonuclease subunit R [Nanchangia anserum]QOX82362.1 type I restriction endonuclease subunit R [Nanchangia anserum]
MTFISEAEFEDAVVAMLQRYGWGEVLTYPSEQDLLDNWAQILYENNRSVDRLGDVPLTNTEMAQILEQVTALRTPLALNEFINGRTVAIRRDAPGATNRGSEVSLKIYDRREIAGGQSRYQIARQPRYRASKRVLPQRRGDLVLLINGMPVIHIELKRSGIPVSQAVNQIDKYGHEGVFSNLFSLVQIFVAMTPEETLYFANPGPGHRVNPAYTFHWADFENSPVNEWSQVIERLLSIPMAHQLIGFYTVADRASGVLMVMRSYQYYAASQIANAVAKTAWGNHDQRGGYIWHTTGSGKTVTSFKTAQLIADSQDADKVVFLLDRRELGEQSLQSYKSFGGNAIEVEDTATSHELLDKLTDATSVLIVTSIQKMSRLNEDAGLTTANRAALGAKRIVFVVDEAHRSTFGDMLATIKRTLPDALFFGFTGTPIQAENQRKHTTTTDLFGDELHRYSLADGIRDHNVLGFDPVMVQTYEESEVREAIALSKARATSVAEALADPDKARVYNHYMNPQAVPMAGKVDGQDGTYVRGIEDELPTSQYTRDEHHRAVVEDITKHWEQLSRGGKFHAILATSSIHEAIEYARIFRTEHPQLNVTALFDPAIDNTGEAQLDKEDGLVEILDDYNSRFGQSFTLATHAQFKADVINRIAHKVPYNIGTFRQLDIVIVVNQLLTGFDSKWVNTLYLDKVIEYENIIQAFSRTNRLFGADKPFGSIRYYRRPWTMNAHINQAVALYAGNTPRGLFVDHLEHQLFKINMYFHQIIRAFGGRDFSKLPTARADRLAFARAFRELYRRLQSVLIQGFTWDKRTYEFETRNITVEITEDDYLSLVMRYQELAARKRPRRPGAEVPIDLDPYITRINTGAIDARYMEERFRAYMEARNTHQSRERLAALLEELHASFARLSADDQAFARSWLHDVESGRVEFVEGKTVGDYINDYKMAHQQAQIARVVRALGVDAQLLAEILDIHSAGGDIEEYGRFSRLCNGVDLQRAKHYFEQRDATNLSPLHVDSMSTQLLREFINHGGLLADLRNAASS